MFHFALGICMTISAYLFLALFDILFMEWHKNTGGKTCTRRFTWGLIAIGKYVITGALELLALYFTIGTVFTALCFIYPVVVIAYFIFYNEEQRSVDIKHMYALSYLICSSLIFVVYLNEAQNTVSSLEFISQKYEQTKFFSGTVGILILLLIIYMAIKGTELRKERENEVQEKFALTEDSIYRSDNENRWGYNNDGRLENTPQQGLSSADDSQGDDWNRTGWFLICILLLIGLCSGCILSYLKMVIVCLKESYQANGVQLHTKQINHPVVVYLVLSVVYKIIIIFVFDYGLLFFNPLSFLLTNFVTCIVISEGIIFYFFDILQNHPKEFVYFYYISAILCCISVYYSISPNMGVFNKPNLRIRFCCNRRSYPFGKFKPVPTAFANQSNEYIEQPLIDYRVAY